MAEGTQCEQGHVRFPKRDTFGIRYAGGLANIILANTTAGTEEAVALQIDKLFEQYEEHDKALCKTFADILGPDCIRGSSVLVTKPLHLSMLGGFKLASLFLNASFHTSNVFASFSDISALQVVVGPIPNSLVEFDNEERMSHLMQHDPGLVMCTPSGAPAFMILQLKMAALVKSCSPASLTLPFLVFVNDTIQRVARGLDPTMQGVLLQSLGWSDYCLVLRGTNTDALHDVADALSGLTISTFVQHWNTLEKRTSRNAAEHYSSLVDQLVAFIRRMEDRGLGHLAMPTKCSELRDSMFCNTWTSLGLCLPVAVEMAEGRGACAVSGHLNGYVRLAFDHAYRHEVDLALRERTSDGHDAKATMLGHFDRVIPFSCLKGVIGYPSEGGRQRYTSNSVLTAYYGLRKILMETTRSGVGGGRPINDLSPMIECYGTTNPKPDPLDKQDENRGIVEYSFRMLMRDAFGHWPVERDFDDLIQQLKVAGVNRNMREAFRQVAMLWRREMISGSDPSHMLEVADAMVVWMNGIHVCLKNGAKAAEITTWINQLARPLWQAITQRALTGYRASEQTDFTLEFKGGLYKLLTGLDGLTECVLALCGPATRFAGIPDVSHVSAARMAKVTVSDPTNQQEYACTAFTMDFNHLVHPMKFADVLHELVHSVVSCRDFVFQLKKRASDANEIDQLFMQSGDGATNLFRERLLEVLVETVLGILLFEDDVALYARTQLLLLGLHPDCHGNGRSADLAVLAEHVLRAYVVKSLLDNNSIKDACDKNAVCVGFDEWWRDNRRFCTRFVSDAEAVSFVDVCKDQLCRWMGNEVFTDVASNFVDATREFFKSDPARATFWNVLAQTRTQTKESWRSDFGIGVPPHYVFHQEKVAMTGNLRACRLEGLVSYLAISRLYYNGLLTEIQARGGELFVLREGGIVVPDPGLNCGSAFFDTLSGTMFTLGFDAGEEYTSSRLAYFVAFWHVAEALKLTELSAIRDACQVLSVGVDPGHGHVFFSNDVVHYGERPLPPAEHPEQLGGIAAKLL